MNTKIYKAVHTLAEQLMRAVQYENREDFDSHLNELEYICKEHEGTDKDHPVQWETLADFTEDVKIAIDRYKKSLEIAESINAKDYISSIRYSMARMQIELGDTEPAINNLLEAKIYANKIEDKTLKAEITTLLESLTER